METNMRVKPQFFIRNTFGYFNHLKKDRVFMDDGMECDTAVIGYVSENYHAQSFDTITEAEAWFKKLHKLFPSEYLEIVLFNGNRESIVWTSTKED